MVIAAGGTPVCRTGHAFIKERMRKEDAIYGGEMKVTIISVISLIATA